ncbi:MAG: hypothetical protein K8S98_10120 [Planctomycetes bacterium]|nr:hypothetical protein [Planctomycetota bacterium]
MKLVIGVIAAAWVLGLLGGAIMWNLSASDSDSMVSTAAATMAIANIVLFVGIIPLVFGARRRRRVETVGESLRSAFRRRPARIGVCVVMLIVALLALIGVFGASHAFNSLLISVTVHVIGICNLVDQVERFQQRDLVHV